MHTFGEDFNYSNATKNFNNLDKLINHINKNSFYYGMSLKYSTPDKYLSEIKNLNKKYTVK